MTSRLLLIGLVVFSQSIWAGQVDQSNVAYESGIYSMSFAVEINADFEKVRAIVTDYGNLAKLSNMLVASTVISTPDEKFKRRLLVLRACVLLFCREVKLVDRIEEIGRDVIVTTVIPELSDFKSGMSHWQLTRLAGGKTRLEFNCKAEPDFWIPPIIGPIMIKHRLQREATIIITNIEALAVNE